jgi:hypothetical protein
MAVSLEESTELSGRQRFADHSTKNREANIAAVAWAFS